MRPGPSNLITDIAGFRVGNSEDHHIKTGTTVLVGVVPIQQVVSIPA